MPHKADNTAVLVDAQESPLQHQVLVRVLRHIERFHNSRSGMFLLQELLDWQNSQMRFFATKFAGDIGPPRFSFSLAPDLSRTPLMFILIPLTLEQSIHPNDCSAVPC